MKALFNLAVYVSWALLAWLVVLTVRVTPLIVPLERES